MCALHGVTMLHVEAMPIDGLAKILLLESDRIEHGPAEGYAVEYISIIAE